MSTNKVSQVTQTSYRQTRNTLRFKLSRNPFKEQQYNQLLNRGTQKRVDFAEWFLKTSSISAERIVCTNETYFCLTTLINRQNNQKWLTAR